MSINHSPVFIKVPHSSNYVYSLPQNLTFKVDCGNKIREEKLITLQGVGKFGLGSQCAAHSNLISLPTHTTYSRESLLYLASEHHLNSTISFLSVDFPENLTEAVETKLNSSLLPVPVEEIQSLLSQDLLLERIGTVPEAPPPDNNEMNWWYITTTTLGTLAAIAIITIQCYIMKVGRNPLSQGRASVRDQQEPPGESSHHDPSSEPQDHGPQGPDISWPLRTYVRIPTEEDPIEVILSPCRSRATLPQEYEGTGAVSREHTIPINESLALGGTLIDQTDKIE